MIQNRIHKLLLDDEEIWKEFSIFFINHELSKFILDNFLKENKKQLGFFKVCLRKMLSLERNLNMRIIMESAFDIIYLFSVISIGIYMIKNSPKSSESNMFGWMSVVLGVGDAFHLIPRVYALNTTGMEANAAFLGFGKAVTSVTMTIFYLILYYIWKKRYSVSNTKSMDKIMIGFTLIRIAISLMPQNRWLEYVQPLDWAIYRNIPFAIMGIIIIVLFYKKSREFNDSTFKNMGLAITLSFVFYAPVVLWGDLNTSIGLLMIPKTMAYVWVVLMGLKELINQNPQI